MITETSGKNELLTAIDETKSQMMGFMSSIDEEKVNNIPYEDSWTPGQLFRHVAKSTSGLASVMGIQSKPAERQPGERIAELKETFLDFSIKMKSPDFIVPENGPYEKKAAMDELDTSFQKMKESTINANLAEMVENLPLGPVTKLELLHFVLYHSQRHLHQMKKISSALQEA